MTEESQLQITPKDGDSSLSLSNTRCTLIARGRRDAAMLARPSSPVASEGDKASTPEGNCYTCGGFEGDVGDGYVCAKCRAREQEMSKIWNKWGFCSAGLPLGSILDDDAVRRDAQAKLEIDRLLKQLGVHERWIETMDPDGQGKQYYPTRGKLQAYAMVLMVNEKWGFDGNGDPVRNFEDGPKRRAAAFEEVNKILGHLGWLLPNDWNIDETCCLNAFEMIECIRALPTAGRR